MAKITICHNDREEDKFGLEGDRFTIGRAKGNDIVLYDDSSSNQHAILTLRENGEYAVTDLESTNHTQVNGRKISGRRLLQDEDRILFGDTMAIYHATDPDYQAPPAEVVAPPPVPGEKKAAKKKEKPKSEPSPEAPPEPGSGCLGIILATAIPAMAYLLIR